MRRLLSHLSYANVVATLALVLAVTGGAYAATQLPKNSVGSKQVTNGSLKAKDFKPGQLPAGPQGVPGPKGEAGAPGPNVLRAGRQDWGQVPLQTGCGSASATTAAFTVAQPSILWASGGGSYVGTGAAEGQSHQPDLVVNLLNAADLVVAQTQPVFDYRVDRSPLSSAGWLAGTAPPGGLFQLQPGVQYRLQVALSVNGSCLGAGYFDAPSVSWSVFAPPS